jgi:glutathione S-transferase
MITLHGLAVSNYYNKVKLTLLEKEFRSRKERMFPSQNETLLTRSPLGKIPFIETEKGDLSESFAIVE